MLLHLTTSHPMTQLLNGGCTRCHIKVMNEEQLMNHLVICQQKNHLNCPTCGFGTQDERSMLIHLTNCHPHVILVFFARALVLKSNNHQSLEFKIVQQKS